MKRAVLRVYSTIGVQAALEELAPKFERASGHELAISWGSAAMLVERIQGGETTDLLGLTRQGIDTLAREGKVATGSDVTLASSGIALAVKKGAPTPDIATPEAFKRTLLGAKSITYTKQGASGVYFAGLIDRLGIADQLKPKIKLVTSADEVGEAVASGAAEFGALPVSEILPIRGAQLGGTFPTDLQTHIVMVAGVSASTRRASAARDLIKSLTAPAALPVIKAKGMEPVAR